MENDAIVTTSVKRQVVLRLLGIDKEWVRSNGQWVDVATLKTSTSSSNQELHDFEEPTRKWWKFWSRS